MSDETKVDPGMAAEIMAGVDAKVDQIQAEISASEDSLPDEAESGDVGLAEPTSSDDAEPPAVEAEEESSPEAASDDPFGGLSNEVMERAVRLGVPLDEIKQYPNDGLLAAMCSRIEAQGGVAGSPEGAGEGKRGAGDGQGDDDPLSAIPDLSREDYDDEIVDVVDGMKGLIRKLLQQNAELRGGQSKDWFSSKLEGVKDLTKGDPEVVSALQAKFDVLKAGYDAVGKDVPDEAIFSEASKSVLGEAMRDAEKRKKSNMARKRNGQFMSRVTNRRVEVKGDPLMEVAAMLDQKIEGGS